MKTLYPDYKNSNMNISCSILRYYGCDPHHETLEDLDRIFDERKPRNVVFMLFDAMGISIIDRHLSASSFIKKHILRSLTSTFPPTTVAATTSINSGFQPIETGWLGWITYFKEINQNVVTFFNSIQNTHDPASLEHLGYTHLPYKPLSVQIREKNPDVKTIAISPFNPNPLDKAIITKSVRFSCDTILETLKEDGRHFIYSYWDDPDASMHNQGVDGISIRPILEDIDENLERISTQIDDDTLVIVTADHSQLNSKWVYLCDYPELQDMLVRPHAVEFRAASLFVKEGRLEEFKKRFNELLGDHFILMSHKEFMESGLLGTGKPHPRTDGFIGDFVAVATDEYCLGDFHEDGKLIGMHAGLTEEEMLVPLIVL